METMLFKQVVDYLLVQLPVVAASIIGIVICLKLYSRFRSQAVLFIIAFSLPILLCILIPTTQEFCRLLTKGDVVGYYRYTSRLAILWSITRGIGYLLFGWGIRQLASFNYSAPQN